MTPEPSNTLHHYRSIHAHPGRKPAWITNPDERTPHMDIPTSAPPARWTTYLALVVFLVLIIPAGVIVYGLLVG